jgi:hypothetical protein
MPTSRDSWIAHLDALSKTQVVEFSGDEFAATLQGLGTIREQVKGRLFVLGHLNCTVVNSVVNPVNGDMQFLGQLGHRKMARDTARVRLMMSDHNPMSQPDRLDGAGQDDKPHGRAVGDIDEVGTSQRWPMSRNESEFTPKEWMSRIDDFDFFRRRRVIERGIQ